MTARKLLKVLPRVLMFKLLDSAVSLYCWHYLLPVLISQWAGLAEGYGLAWTIYAVGATSFAVDVAGGAAAWLAVSKMCGSIPELAGREADREAWADEYGGGDDDDDDLIVELATPRSGLV